MVDGRPGRLIRIDALGDVCRQSASRAET